jgi:hypothetical protein
MRPIPARIRRWADPLLGVELFALANVAFLAGDIFLAHSINAFEQPAEWVPFAFSIGAPIVLLVAMALGGLLPMTRDMPGSGRQRLARGLGLAVGWGSVAVGVAGLVLHLESQFFEEQTLKNLVYTAPFAAPLAYAGIGLLLILNRMVAPRTVEWGRWVALLALGGFAGNFVLSLADHAQNGFFEPAEWTGVIASAYAIGALLAVVAVPENRPLRRLCGAVMAVQVVVGLVGFGYHARANWLSPMGRLWDRFIYGAPIFAPLLFADLALLGSLALWALATAEPTPAA